MAASHDGLKQQRLISLFCLEHPLRSSSWPNLETHRLDPPVGLLAVDRIFSPLQHSVYLGPDCYMSPGSIYLSKKVLNDLCLQVSNPVAPARSYVYMVFKKQKIFQISSKVFFVMWVHFFHWDQKM